MRAISFPVFLWAAMLATGCSRPKQTTQPIVPMPNQPRQAQMSPQDLAKRIGFPEELVTSILKHGSNVRQLIGFDAEANEKPAAGLLVDVTTSNWHDTVNGLREEVGPGYLVFCHEQRFGRGPDEIAVLRGNDQFDILKAVGTSGPNYEIGPDKVLARVQEWDRKFGLDIIAAGDDWMEAGFKRTPPDMQAFAQEVYKFCPDVVTQGTDTVQALEREMKQTNSVYLWWD